MPLQGNCQNIIATAAGSGKSGTERGGLISLRVAGLAAGSAPQEGTLETIAAAPAAGLRLPLTHKGRLETLRVAVTANTYAGALTVNLLVNGVATLSLTMNAGATGEFINPNSVLVTEGDKISFGLVPPAGTGSADLQMSTLYVPFV